MSEESEVLELAEEEEDNIIKEYATRNKVFLLSCIAPFKPLRVSPASVVYAELSPPEEFAIESFINKVKETGIPKDNRTLELLLHSYGGGVDSAYMIAKVLRNNFSKIRVYIPHIAASGATLIAISADEIVMGEISRLSPIDVIQTTQNGERISLLAYLRGFLKLNDMFKTTRKEDIPYPYLSLIEDASLSTFEEFSGVLSQVEGYAIELMNKAGYTDEEAERISERLVYGPLTHNEVIDFEKAKEIGLKVKFYEEFKESWSIMRRWLSKYILKESGIHHIKCVIPEVKKNEIK
jgi:ATP-dependent protease ClpP protease subunit